MQPLWKTVWRILKKLKIELPHDPAIPLLRIYPKETKTLIQKDICTPMFTATLFTIVKTRKQPTCPSTDEWIKKLRYIYVYIYHIHMEYYSAIKKEEILPFVTTWLDLEGIMLSEINQRKTNTVWSHLYMESKKKPTTTNKKLNS